MSRQDERHLIPSLEIMSAADDLPLALPIVDTTKGELVRVRMFVAGDYLRDHYPFKFTFQLLHALNFNAEHRQPLGQFFRRPIEIDVLFEPVEGDFHVSMILRRVSPR